MVGKTIQKCVVEFGARLSGQKVIDQTEKSSLKRSLTVIDLISLGVGSTLGVGVYVIAGEIARNDAGPAVIISFLIAAIASVFAGLCYAEFGARVPRAGSAYVYSYVSTGELIAFIIGWSLVLEYVIGAASVAKGFTKYIDDMCGNEISNALRSSMPIDIEYFAKFPDFLAFGLTAACTIALAFGLKESSRVNNVITFINLTVIVFFIIAGSIRASPKNWKIDPADVPEVENVGDGGFFPFGFAGVIQGAARCFFAFVGFDCIATTGEEAINPQKSIPLAIIGSLTIVFLAYFGISTVLTMMTPYYAIGATLASSFETDGWEWARWIVTVGALFSLTASLFGALVPLPRVIYAMANDGILFKFLGRVNPRLQTPLIATLTGGLLTGVLSILVDFDALVEMMSIGTILAYTIVAGCVLKLRYNYDPKTCNTDNKETTLFRQLFNLDKCKEPNTISSGLITVCVLLYTAISFGFTATIVFMEDNIINVEGGALTLLIILALCLIGLVIIIYLQAPNPEELNFKVPAVPIVPCISITFNIYLMIVMKAETWIRLVGWLAIGFLIYFFYGIWKSEVTKKRLNKME